MTKQIKYYEGVKYELAKSVEILTTIRPETAIISTGVLLQPDGLLFIMCGTTWDGPSGPTIDVPEFMRASLVHDVLYRLMREGKLPQSFKKAADKLMKQMCIEDGMSYPLAQIAYEGVEHFGYSSCEVQEREILTAP